MEINTKTIIDAYNKGESMTSIAKTFGTYPITIKRLLEKNKIELRHDVRRKGTFVVEDGEKLIEWAKTQGRPVTKTELAEIIGKKKLSPSYFIKYPELGKYIKTNAQKELKNYNKTLYDFLQKNNIKYKPNDRTKLGMSVTALLLGEYKGNIALQIRIKPSCISCKDFYKNIEDKLLRAKKAGIALIFIDEDDFEKGLETIKDLLLHIKK